MFVQPVTKLSWVLFLLKMKTLENIAPQAENVDE